MNVTCANPQTHAEMIAMNKAIKARWAQASRNIKQDPPPVVKEVYVPYMAVQLPAWTTGKLYFDAHVIAREAYRAHQASFGGSPMKSYILTRCAELGVKYSDVISQNRSREVARARQMIMWEIKTKVKPSASLPEIGRLFGGRDHTTVIHAVRKFEQMAGAE